MPEPELAPKQPPKTVTTAEVLERSVKSVGTLIDSLKQVEVCVRSMHADMDHLNDVLRRYVAERTHVHG